MTQKTFLVLTVLVALLLMSCRKSSEPEIEEELVTIVESNIADEPLVITGSQKEDGLSVASVYMDRQIYEKGETIQVEVEVEYVKQVVDEIRVVVECNSNVELSEMEYYFSEIDNLVQDGFTTTILNSSELLGRGTIEFYMMGVGESIDHIEEQRLSMHYYADESIILFTGRSDWSAEMLYWKLEFDKGNIDEVEYRKRRREIYQGKQE